MATKDVTLSIRLTDAVKDKLLAICAVSAPGGLSQSAMIARLIVAEAKRQKISEQNEGDKNEKTNAPAFR